MKKTIPLLSTLILLVVSFDTTKAQETTATLPAKDFEEAQIEQYAEQILSIEDDRERLELNNELIDLLKVQLNRKGAFSYPFNSISSMTVLSSPDSLFRLFNWSVPMSDGSYQYECLMLKQNENGNGTVSRLIPIQTDTLKTPLESFKGNQSQWPQALYYELIQKKTFNRTYYTLLAWDGHNRLTKRKWIEVFWFNRNGELQMGAPIFKHPGKQMTIRPVFRYSAQHAMKMRYNEDEDRIEFDFLAPENSRLEGVYEYYFPDVTQDAYRWNSDFWEFEKLIDNEDGTKRAKKQIEKQKKEIILEQGTIYESN